MKLNTSDNYFSDIWESDRLMRSFLVFVSVIFFRKKSMKIFKYGFRNC